MRTKDLGFSKAQQLIIPLRSSNAKNIYTPLKDEVKRNQLVEQVGATLYYPGIMNPSDMSLRRPKIAFYRIPSPSNLPRYVSQQMRGT